MKPRGDQVALPEHIPRELVMTNLRFAYLDIESRIVAIYEDKMFNFQTFCPIILLNNHLLTIWQNFFEQLSIDVKSAVTFQKWPLVAELKLKKKKKTKMTDLQTFNFSSATTGHCTFYIYGSLFITVTWRVSPQPKLSNDRMVNQVGN